MKLEAVTISVDYDDLLEITLPENKQYFDNYVVVTNESDVGTRKICEKEGVECVRTNAFYINNFPFCKGAGLNVGLSMLKYNDWCLIMDADVVLPKGFLNILSGLDPECFYGCRRYSIPKRKDYDIVKNDPERLSDYTLYRGYGYGYFQLFNMGCSTIKKILETRSYIYPITPNVAESDWMLRNTWGEMVFDPPLGQHQNPHSIKDAKDPCYGLLRELPIRVLHLGEDSKNESRRVTKRF